jgi:hypothetical protein
MVVVTKKKIRSRKAISAIEPELISGKGFLLRRPIVVYLNILDTSVYTTAAMANPITIIMVRRAASAK